MMRMLLTLAVGMACVGLSTIANAASVDAKNAKQVVQQINNGSLDQSSNLWLEVRSPIDPKLIDVLKKADPARLQALMVEHPVKDTRSTMAAMLSLKGQAADFDGIGAAFGRDVINDSAFGFAATKIFGRSGAGGAIEAFVRKDGPTCDAKTKAIEQLDFLKLPDAGSVAASLYRSLPDIRCEGHDMGRIGDNVVWAVMRQNPDDGALNLIQERASAKGSRDRFVALAALEKIASPKTRDTLTAIVNAKDADTQAATRDAEAEIDAIKKRGQTPNEKAIINKHLVEVTRAVDAAEKALAAIQFRNP